MERNGWKWREMEGNGVEMERNGVEMEGNGGKWREMEGNGGKWSRNGEKWRKLREMEGNGGRLREIARLLGLKLAPWHAVASRSSSQCHHFKF